MPEKPNPDELVSQLENAESTELDEASLEDVAGGDVNCHNSNCCKPPVLETA
jgi:hypothetical protein